MSHHIKRSVILAILAVLVGLAAAKSELLAYAGHTCPPSAEEGVKHVNPGDDLDAIVNSDPATSATTFCIHAGTYLIDSVVVPRDGDALLGEPGRSTVLGPATKPEPVVLVRNGAALSRLVQPTGSNIHLEWLDISGANVRYNSQARDTCRQLGRGGQQMPAGGYGGGHCFGQRRWDTSHKPRARLGKRGARHRQRQGKGAPLRVHRQYPQPRLGRV